jgi:hypothetical protein|tara:strand:+ start:73 stop:474 length:402 start_codon:yes stop_codon:yes gene_type:complete
MKSRKYLAGGLIKGIGGTAIKSFVKSDLYKGLKSKMIKDVNKLYSTAKVNEKPSRKIFLKNLKKLDIKNQKANIIRKALSITKGPVMNLDRKMKVALKLGARNTRKYQKKLQEIGASYMAKGVSDLIKKKKPN